MFDKYDLNRYPDDPMYRHEYARDDEWIQEFLNRAEVGYVATLWDEQPFITPVTFVYDHSGHQIYFHTASIGRLRANIEIHNRVCFATSEHGKFLPSEFAMEFNVQYRSVLVFGETYIIEDPEKQKYALYSLINKYFPALEPGKDYRLITDQEIKRTAVFAIMIDRWSGKENWPN